MSKEAYNKESFKNEINLKDKFEKKEIINIENQLNNLDLNKVKAKNRLQLSKNKKKICINSLQNRLREKEVKEKYENRILYGLFVSAIAILFFVST